jgi:hypothetical protein
MEFGPRTLRDGKSGYATFGGSRASFGLIDTPARPANPDSSTASSPIALEVLGIHGPWGSRRVGPNPDPNSTAWGFGLLEKATC